MTDNPREVLAQKLRTALCTGWDYTDEDGEPGRCDGPYMDAIDLDWTLIDGRVNLLNVVDLILADYLVVPRSDIQGTEYGWRIDSEDATQPATSKHYAVINAEDNGGEAVERPILPWTPIPEEGNP